ncbi:MAG: MFS transporter [Acidimicrobiales bacterium]|nr:MFS transporter [Acidimicrobiales bacterium]
MAVDVGAEDEVSSGVTTVVLTAWPLLASILLLMTGSGLQGSLLGVRAEQAAFSSAVTGAVLGLYYLGYVAGSTWAPGLIRRVGHIRVFAALAAIASAAVLIHGVWVSPVPWLLLRGLTGACVAGLFVVTESWLNDVAASTTRATLLSVYNTVVTGGLAAGTLLLNVASPTGVVLFVIGSVAVSLAAVPITLAPSEAPAPQESEPVPWDTVFRIAPLGITGVVVSGMGVGAVAGFGAVYATRAGFGVSGASQFVVAVLVGAIVGQIPLGNWSDRTDRRYVMLTAGALIVAGSVIGVAGTVLESLPLALLAALVVGAGAFSLYGLSMAHQADYMDPIHVLSAGSRLLTANGLGAASGPFLASIAIGLMGPEGMFRVLIVVGSVFCVFVVFRMFRRGAVAESRRAHYTPIAATSTVAGLDDLVSETTGVDSDVLRRRLRRARMIARRASDAAGRATKAAGRASKAAGRTVSKAAAARPRPAQKRNRRRASTDEVRRPRGRRDATRPRHRVDDTAESPDEQGEED